VKAYKAARTRDVEWHCRPRVMQLLRHAMERIPSAGMLDRKWREEGKRWDSHTGLWLRLRPGHVGEAL